MYQCRNTSKCISIHRFDDTFIDCPYMDDENTYELTDQRLINQLNKTHHRCQASNRYIHPSFFNNKQCDCGYIENNLCEDEDFELISIRKNILFERICDGLEELFPQLIDGQNHTDENECQVWECDNLYTHCNGIWNCPNGFDKTGCSLRLNFNCLQNFHYCISPETNELTCLSIEKANDGIVDCLGGTDEPYRCQQMGKNGVINKFYCENQCLNSSKLCDGKIDCLNSDDDERFCMKNRSFPSDEELCSRYASSRLDSEQFLCQRFKVYSKESKLSDVFLTMINSFDTMSSRIRRSSSVSPYDFRCHRGIDLLVWTDSQKGLTSRTCLCPSMYYGPQCQYQNQRIALTVKFLALSDSWQTLFAIVISLRDENIIHSYEQISFHWQINCETKFHFYLLYANRPKDLSKNYSIQVDIYEKDALKYRGSLIYPIQFSFLPVHRQSIYVRIPPTYEKFNEPIQPNCSCSSESHCVGLLPNNRSICVCKTNHSGSRCFLNTTICQSNNHSMCSHGGRCLPNDGYLSTEKQFICICPQGYLGARCEDKGNQLITRGKKRYFCTLATLRYFQVL